MHLRLIFLVLLFSFTLFSNTFSQWTALSSGTLRDLNDVYFVDTQTGWVVGDSGLIMKTTDGGTSWSNQVAGIADIISVSFLDADTGYAMTGFYLPWVTYNGGTTWQYDSTLVNGCFATNLEFNDRILYLAYQGCFGGNWLITLDPATKDTTERFDFTIPYSYNDFGFPEPGVAFAMGPDDMIARTVDGGDTWNVTGPGDTALDWKAVDFINQFEGYAVTDHIFSPLYKTIDAGFTWMLDSAWMSTFFYPTATDLDYRDPGFGFVTTDIQWSTQGVIFEMRPGAWGNYISIPNVPRAIHMADDSVGYVVGDSGMIWKRTGGPLAITAAQDQLDFEVYPNPAGSEATVLWRGQAEGTLRVFHSDGRLVSASPAQPGMVHLDLTGLVGGVYLVSLEAEGKTAVKRLVLIP